MGDVSLYDVSVGLYIKAVTVLLHLLEKAAAHPDSQSLPNASLIDDMKPLSFQVQAVSHTVTRSLRRLSLSEAADWPDDESTMEQLITRAQLTLDLLQSVDPKKLEGKANADVKMPQSFGPRTGGQFILGFGVPNMFFHLQTAYAILRMKGVPLGKDDYISTFNAL